MLNYIAMALLLVWLLGLLLPWGGGNLLHGLLVIGLILLILEWLRTRH